jgi:hypothetical protein
MRPRKRLKAKHRGEISYRILAELKLRLVALQQNPNYFTWLSSRNLSYYNVTQI